MTRYVAERLVHHKCQRCGDIATVHLLSSRGGRYFCPLHIVDEVLRADVEWATGCSCLAREEVTSR